MKKTYFIHVLMGVEHEKKFCNLRTLAGLISARPVKDKEGKENRKT